MGRLGSESPARLRRMALATRSRASSCPMTRWRRRSSMVHQFLRFAFEQAPDGNAGPLADQLGDVFFVHFFLEHAAVLSALRRRSFLRGGQFALGRGEFAVADFRDLARVRRSVRGAALPPSAVRSVPSACEFWRWRLFPPASGPCARWIPRAARPARFSICFSRSLECASVSLQQRLALDFQLQDAPLDFVDFHGQRIDLHAQAGGGLHRSGRWPCPEENGR